MAVQLERYLPLPDAARRFGVSQAALRRLIDSGQVKGVALPGGEIGVAENGVRAFYLKEFIALPEAARQLNLSEASLLRLVKSGNIEAASLPDGEIVVSKTSAQVAAINEQLKAIKRADFAKLKGKPVTITEAVEKYDIPNTTLRDWTQRPHHVTVLKEGYGKELDEGDVAYCAKVYHVRRAAESLSGAPLLDAEGSPNLLKHPHLSEYRRRKKKETALVK
jgi:hypothetical protein